MIDSLLYLYAQALTSHDSTRTRIWFPMFSYFESSVDGIIPNEYSSLEDICSELFGCIANVRHSCMLTARRFWLANQQLVSPEFSKKIFPFGASNEADTAPSDDAIHPTASTTKDINESFASNNLNGSNVGTQHTKKYN